MTLAIITDRFYGSWIAADILPEKLPETGRWQWDAGKNVRLDTSEMYDNYFIAPNQITFYYCVPCGRGYFGAPKTAIYLDEDKNALQMAYEEDVSGFSAIIGSITMRCNTCRKKVVSIPIRRGQTIPKDLEHLIKPNEKANESSAKI